MRAVTGLHIHPMEALLLIIGLYLLLALVALPIWIII